MRGRIFTLAVLAAVVALVAPMTAGASPPWPGPESYLIAGSVGFDVTVGPAQANNAFGPVDCDTNIGGACFDLGQAPQGLPFTVTATDSGPAGSVGIFMGFDVDGDGCVGCANGNGPPGSPGNPDMFWQGADSVDGFVVASPDGLLMVFIRLITLNTLDVPATAGEIDIVDCGLQGPCNPAPDFDMGTACVRDEGGLPIGEPEPQGDPGERKCPGQEFRMMYPYPDLPPRDGD